MTTFTLVGTPDPFLHVSMQQGEQVYCESNAMVMMEDTLELKGKLQGGLLQSMMRKFATGESLFQQQIVAVHGAGDCLLTPTLDGDLQILDVGPRQYMLTDGAFVAATSQVDVKAAVQTNIGSALFGDTGGFIIMKASGQGQVVVSGYGSIFEIEVTPNKPITVDNGHVVAWDSTLQHQISVATGRGTGMVGKLVNSLTSGEGMVLKFSGSGKVLICSRNRNNFLTWLTSKLPGSSSSTSNSFFE